MKKKYSSKTPLEVLVCVALLTALQIVLSRFLSVQLWNMKFGLSFIPVVIAARLFGPLGAMAVYGIGDIIGTLLFPVGAYFPGFTFSAVISGLIFGLFLWKKCSFARIAISVFLNQLITSLLLNSLWLSITSGTPFTAQMAARWPQSLLTGVIMIVLMAAALERICKPIEGIIFKNKGKIKQ